MTPYFQNISGEFRCLYNKSDANYRRRIVPRQCRSLDTHIDSHSLAIAISVPGKYIVETVSDIGSVFSTPTT
jgi:hypothetical protein